MLYNFSSSQSAPIIGKVINPQNEPLELVTVALLHHKDSTMINYTVTDSKGLFKIVENSRDTLLIQLHSTGYIPYFRMISYNKKIVDLKTITLEEETTELDAIVISAVIPVQIKNDTIAFNASSFKVNSDDNIEKLLGKLPGIEIDSDGKIVAQGNEVTKIFVDGKEFFGGDPTIVLKNLSADAIQKVEVIDKKSYESELTGVEDGEKEVVINFTLKKSKQKNGFGKASAGMGSDNRYFSNLNYNRFTTKSQVSVIGKFNNINVTGSNIKGFLKNANGIGDESDDTESDILKNRSLSGYLETGVAGINIGQEFMKKEFLNADYFYNSSVNKGTSHSRRINFSNNSDYDFESENEFENSTKNHNFNFNYKNQSSKTYSLFIDGGLVANQLKSFSARDGSYYNEEDTLVTSKIDDFRNNVEKNSGKIQLRYFQRLQKQGRSFNTKVKLSNQNIFIDNENHSFINRRLNTSNPNTRDILISRDEEFRNSNINFNFIYTEPLGGNHFAKIETHTTVNTNKENTDQQKTITTNNTSNENLMFKYLHTVNNYQSRLVYSYYKKVFNFYSALEFQDLNTSYGQVNQFEFKKSQFYLNPIVTAQYRPKKGVKYKFDYRRLIKNPNPTQSSSIVNDMNPYFIRKGNPNLKTEKINKFLFQATIHNYKNAMSLFSTINYQFSTDAIIQSIDIDEDYIKTRSYQNIGNRKRFNSVIGLTKKINGLGLRYSLRNRFLYNTSNSIINLELNDVEAKNFMVSLSFENYNKNNFDVKTGASFTSNNTTFSIAQDLNRKYTKQQYFTMFDVDVSKRLNFNTQFDFLVFTDDQFTEHQSFSLWNASVSYNLSKNKNSILKLVFIDLLDNNIDIYRRSTSNYFEETTSESLGRYAILSYTYKLNNQKRKKNL